MGDDRDIAAQRLYQRAARFRYLASRSIDRLTAGILLEASRECEEKAALAQPIWRSVKPREG
jgi:hypothetical protein